MLEFCRWNRQSDEGPEEGKGVVAVWGIGTPPTGVRAGEGLWGTTPNEEGPGDGEGDGAGEGRMVLCGAPGATEDEGIIP